MRMEEECNRRFSVQLSFEEICLPPFEDILILSKKCSQGKHGVTRSFEFLIPNEFEVIDVDDKIVETIFINKRVLIKMDRDSILKILREKVFPFISENEILKVDFKIKISYN